MGVGYEIRLYGTFVGSILYHSLPVRMTYQDIINIVLILAIAVYFFSDGGPGTPKRIRIPLPVRSPIG